MIVKFRYHSENLAIAKFRYSIAKFLISSIASYTAFPPFQLDISSYRLDEIVENSNELSIKHHNYDAKLDMMAEVPINLQNYQNNLEIKSVVLNGPTHVNRLN